MHGFCAYADLETRARCSVFFELSDLGILNVNDMVLSSGVLYTLVTHYESQIHVEGYTP